MSGHQTPARSVALTVVVGAAGMAGCLAIGRIDGLPMRTALEVAVLSALAALALLSCKAAAAAGRARRNEARSRAIHRDLLRQCDELTAAKSAAEAAGRAKDEFLAGISHEIRTPLTAILGYAELLRAEADAGDGVRGYAAVIQRSGQHLLRLLGDILDLSKIEAGRLTLDFLPTSPRAVLNEVVALLRVKADAKGLRLETRAVAPLPETIRADPLRLRQALVNLVDNAIKFTDCGEVRVTVQLDFGERRPRFRFDVTDSGIGMNEEQIGRLFKPFCQVDSSPARRSAGTGLGLAISKRLIEAMGGDIYVRSAPGKGSTFSVLLDPGPLDDLARLAAAETVIEDSPEKPKEDSGGPLDQRRILLADDGLQDRRYVVYLLEKAGAQVTVADNGKAAVDAALAAETPFDLILMDMWMPVMDGRAASRQLRQHGYTGPIIALTAPTVVEDCQSCFEAGCDDFVNKPVDRQRLLDVVALWTCREADDSPATLLQAGAL